MADKNCRFSDQLINDIAQEIDMGMTYFLNLDTLELESAMGNPAFQNAYQKQSISAKLVRFQTKTTGNVCTK